MPKAKVYIDGQSGTTGLQIFDRIGARDDLELLRIPEDKRMDAAVAVAIANYGMINGSFDLDMSDGEIRFRVTQSYADMELSQECISYLIGIVFFTTDKYNDKFFMLGLQAF